MVVYLQFLIMNAATLYKMYVELKTRFPQYYHQYDGYIDKMYLLARDYCLYIHDEPTSRTITLTKKEAELRLRAIIKNHFYLVIE